MAKKSNAEFDKRGQKFVAKWSHRFNSNDDGCHSCVVQIGYFVLADESPLGWYLIGMRPSSMEVCFMVKAPPIVKAPPTKEGVSWSLVNRYIQSSRGLKVHYRDKEVNNDLVDGARELVEDVKKQIDAYYH